MWKCSLASSAPIRSGSLQPVVGPGKPAERSSFTCGSSKDGVMRPTKVSAEYGVSLAKGKTSVAGAAA